MWSLDNGHWYWTVFDLQAQMYLYLLRSSDPNMVTKFLSSMVQGMACHQFGTSHCLNQLLYIVNWNLRQGVQRSGKSQGNSRLGKSQGKVREFCWRSGKKMNIGKSQGKVRECAFSAIWVVKNNQKSQNSLSLQSIQFWRLSLCTILWSLKHPILYFDNLPNWYYFVMATFGEWFVKLLAKLVLRQ